MQEVSQTKRLSSSLRTRTAEESLKIAPEFARSRGVSRVVDTTRLDRIGIPVYTSIRPDGMKQSIGVHAGKGFTHAEAKIGSYMEAIEYSFAEPNRSHIDCRIARPGDVVSSFNHELGFPDFGTCMGVKVDPEDPLAVIDAEEISKGLGPVLLPAELVYHPFPNNPGKRYYGTCTTGLASGNTIMEATVHGLAEVMERDVHTLDALDSKTRWISKKNLPPKILAMGELIEKAGMTWHLRYRENDFGMPFIMGYVLEPDEAAPISLAAGCGFHPIREIAAVRGLAEAVQSRLTVIHGGREDIMKQVNIFEANGRERTLNAIRKRRAEVANEDDAIDYLDIPDFEPQIHRIDDALALMCTALRNAGMPHVARVVFTEPHHPFQVVRISVPGAQMFRPEIQRVGPRLLKYFNYV